MGSPILNTGIKQICILGQSTNPCHDNREADLESSNERWINVSGEPILVERVGGPVLVGRMSYAGLSEKQQATRGTDAADGNLQ